LVLFDGEVLVAGLGSAGERHVRNLLAEGQTNVTVLRRAEKPTRTLEQESFRTITSAEEAIARKPTAIIIATPSALHVPLLAQAVDAGIPVMVEVPLASSPDGLQAVADQATATGVPVLIAHNLRFHPCLQQVRESVQRGDVGDVLYSQAQFGEFLPSSHTWEDYRTRYEARADLGGGAIYTSLHELDHAVWLFGKADSVTSVTRTRWLDVDVEDTAILIIEHASGVLSQITLDFVQRPYRRWLQVVGSEGTLEWEFLSNEVRRFTTKGPAWEKAFSAPGYDAGDTYVDELRHLARVVRREEAPVVDLAHAMHVLAVAIAAHESSATGSRVPVDP
jgi:predicted dehydrogenase